MRSCVITSAVRTAVGGYLGSLRTVPDENLMAAVIKEAIKRSNLTPNQIDHVVGGCVCSEVPNVTRCGALLAGVPEEVPAFTVDRQCGSSLQALVSATQEIYTESSEIVVTGGVESMSRHPVTLPRFSRYEGFRLGNSTLYDFFTTAVTRVQPPTLYPGVNMGITAENVAAKYNISRQEQDEFALHSHQKWAAAHKAGKFTSQILPFEVADKKKSFVFDTDEHPQPNTTLEILAKLKPAFKKEGGSVTAGNASGMNDGASAVVLMTPEKAASLNIKPMVKVICTSNVGVSPPIMGIGPAPAVRKILQKTGLTLEDIGLFELNEAFAAQALGVLKELGMSPGTKLYDRVNVNGGAVAHGHALGNSGTRILTTLIYEMKARNVKYGIASLCIGGGMGIAALVENV